VPKGSLTVVGTGIALGVHLTAQARVAIERADTLFYLMSDQLGDRWISELNADARPLRRHYAPDRERADTYEAMVEEIMAAVRSGRNVCSAFYGHPGVFASPSHESVRRARAEGYEARMLPAVSAEDCLFADLGVDPGQNGCQSYEATDFLLRRKAVDTTATLVLWQVAFVGVTRAPVALAPGGVKLLVDYLRTFYEADHPSILYEASPYPVGRPRVAHVPLQDVAGIELGALSTLFVPPVGEAPVDEAMRARLGQAVAVDSEYTDLVASPG
jgi:uncharacterized protein YabN with tetrapyrrole methylase and pyrophosphatase domain